MDLTRAGVSAFNGVLVGTVISVLYPPQYGVDRDLRMWMFIVVGSFLRYVRAELEPTKLKEIDPIKSISESGFISRMNISK